MIRDDKFVTGCGSDTWVLPAYGAVLARYPYHPIRLIEVGANKGYVLADFIGYWAPERGVNAQMWQQLVIKYAALLGNPRLMQSRGEGSCKNRARGQRWRTERDQMLAARKSTAPIEVHAFEMTPRTMELLQFASKEAAVADIAHLYGLPVSDVATKVIVCNNGPGDEMNHVHPAGNFKCPWRMNQTTVETTTLDAFVEERFIRDVLHVVIDAEGWDPLVLRGFTRALSQKQVRLLEFEYHDVGVWDPNHKKTTSLANTVQWLAAIGYTCYMQAVKGLIPISATCWRDDFEIRRWSNVLCTHDDLVIQTLQQRGLAKYYKKAASA